MATKVLTGDPSQARQTFKLIDCDIHPNFALPWRQELAPFMPREWAIRFSSGEDYHGSNRGERGSVGYRLPHNCFYPRTGGAAMRMDLMGPNGEAPATNPVVSAHELLDAYAIDRAILIPQDAQAIGVFPDPDVAIEFAAAINRWIADKWLSSDSRWRGTITVAIQDPPRAAEEIRRWAQDSRFAAIYLSLSNVLMGHRSLYPIYAAAQEYELPITVHPEGAEGIYVTAPQWAGGPPTHYLDHRMNFGLSYQASLSNLVATGVFERFPQLRVVFTEFGYAWLPEFLWRIDTIWKSQRDATPWVKRPPSEYVIEHCRFSTQPFIEPSRPEFVDQIFEMIHAGQVLMFSTDYPHWDSEAPEQILDKLPAKFKSQILWETAAALYGRRLV